MKGLPIELGKLDKEITSVTKKLANENFVSKAPAEIVRKEREKLTTLEAARQTLTESRQRLSANG